jgi:hypothetical protein
VFLSEPFLRLRDFLGAFAELCISFKSEILIVLLSFTSSGKLGGLLGGSITGGGDDTDGALGALDILTFFVFKLDKILSISDGPFISARGWAGGCSLRILRSGAFALVKFSLILIPSLIFTLLDKSGLEEKLSLFPER